MNNIFMIIDTDLGFKQRFEKKLVEESISDDYTIKSIVPDTSVSSDNLIPKCIEEIKKSISSDSKIMVIFVDIVIYEKKELDSVGIDLAKSIKKSFPYIPVINITGFFRDEKEADLIADASLENIEGVFPKSYLDGETFSYRRLKNILSKANDKVSHKNSFFLADKQQLQPEINLNYSYPDQRVKSLIKEIGQSDFINLLSSIFPNSEGTISYLQLGRSGAYVFKLYLKFNTDAKTPTKAKRWIFKVSRDQEIITREVENYIEVTKSSLPKSFYPQLFKSQSFSSNGLSGLAYEYEEDSQTIMKFIENELVQEDIDIIVNQIETIIKHLYGDSQKKACYIWDSFYSFTEEVWNNLLFFLQENKCYIDTIMPNDTYETVLTFVQSKGIIKNYNINKLESEVEIRNIHGDFNSGNILINKKKELILIDFASINKNHIVRDIAKLERDIIYKVIDSSSPDYYDWSKLSKWRPISHIYRTENFFSSAHDNSLKDTKIENSIFLIKKLREVLINYSSHISIKEYLVSILHYTLLSLLLPDVSIHKKALAIENIKFILEILSSK